MGGKTGNYFEYTVREMDIFRSFILLNRCKKLRFAPHFQHWLGIGGVGKERLSIESKFSLLRKSKFPRNVILMNISLAIGETINTFFFLNTKRKQDSAKIKDVYLLIMGYWRSGFETVRFFTRFDILGL